MLSNPSDDNSVIPLVNSEGYRRLKETGVVSDGMLPKIDNAFLALEKGVSEVYIKNWADITLAGGTMLKL